MKTVWLFERGINGYQGLFGDWNNWPNEAIAWVHKRTDARAQTLVYFTTAITAGLTRRDRANNFWKMAEAYRGWDEINIAAHSEGTATVVLSMSRPNFPPIDNLHLICGAVDSDFEKNGLNEALDKNKVQTVHCWIADKDMAMRIENTPIGLFLFKVPFGHTPLGLKGPKNAHQQFASRVRVRHWKNFGHSDCWSPYNFNATMLGLINPP